MITNMWTDERMSNIYHAYDQCSNEAAIRFLFEQCGLEYKQELVQLLTGYFQMNPNYLSMYSKNAFTQLPILKESSQFF